MRRIAVRGSSAGLALLLWAVAAGAGETRFWEQDGVVSMETEHADSRGQWKEEGPGDGSSGTYMTSQNRRARDDSLEFGITFIKPGWYKVWLRSRCTTDADNDCYVTLDGKPGYVPLANGWRKVTGIKTNFTSFRGWDSQVKEEGMALDQRKKGCHVFVSQPGFHTLGLGSRSKGYKIDKVVLLNLEREDAGNGPAGAGPAETWTYPHFPPEAESQAVLSIQKSISAGTVGAKLPLLLELVQSSEDAVEKREAAETLNLANAWIKAKSEAVTAMVGEGRHVGALIEVNMVNRALEGHPMQQAVSGIGPGLRGSSEFRIGMQFYQMLRIVQRMPPRQRAPVLDQFGQKYPQSWYGRFAKTLMKQGLP